MKTVAKINPEKEYETAKKLIELASKQMLDTCNASTLDASVDNLMTAARVLMEREARRRAHEHGTPPKNAKPKGRKKGDKREESNKLPSSKFPDLEIKETVIAPEHPPFCTCCNKPMSASGLFDVSEKLEVIPKRYYIQRNKRVKFNCSHCHGSMVNTPAIPSIVPTSNYGDSFIIDVALSKYCDIIPMERYVQIAFRSGLEDLPAQSLIGLTHYSANFLLVIYEMIKKEVLLAKVLQADETTHRMLEGDDTCNWYLWGFFCSTACYLEPHNTRSGDVPFNFLQTSQADFLLTDGFSGYGRAIRMIEEKFNRKLIEVHCNAHAYRYFEDAAITWKEECKVFLELYGEIYELERTRKEQRKKLSPEEQLEFRKQMLPIFEKIKENCEQQKKNTMAQSSFLSAITYFLNQYKGLIVCTTNVDIPLDNNLAERELRAPVIGRKTWYGTHSKRGATTCAILFSIVQTCKLNNVNPRNYFPWIVDRIHRGESLMTPHEYFKYLSSSSPPSASTR